MPTLTEIDGFPSWTTRATSGDVIQIRPVHESDAAGLQHYFRSLSKPSRYRRFMGAVSELSPEETARIIGKGPVPTFAVVAEIHAANVPSIVGEANCALDIEGRHGDLAVSVEDRWQRHGIGFALLYVMECCATRMGLRRLLGEALQSNDQMRGLAKRAGFAVTQRPGEWDLVHIEKHLPSSGLSPG
jgi:GNAT superfamily N-acetyltransferase